MMKSNKCLAQNFTHMVMVGSATDLSGLSPAHLNALTQHEQTPRPRGRLGPVQAGPNPATKVKKTKTKKDVKPVSILIIFS